MTGIVGMLDPAGVDVALLGRAATVAAHRGKARIVAGDQVAFGVLQRDAEVQVPTVGASGSMFVTDARIDAILGPPAAGHARGRATDASIIDAILAHSGPDGLESISADFAVARFDAIAGELLLARDALGQRPLYWGRRGHRIGFASDPEVLIGMGVVDDRYDHDALVGWLLERGDSDDRTAIAGLHRVEPGHAVRFGIDGVAATRRWFRPERIPTDPGLTLDAAAKEAKEALIAGVTSRSAGRRVALTLSSGRDSSAVAVALAEAGIKATCITYELEAQGVPSEAGVARELSRSLGHDFHLIRVSPHLDEDRLAEFVAMAGGPLQAVGIPIQLAIHDALREVGADVVLAGEGGDLLFMGFPITVFDLLRAGRLRQSILAANNYQRLWTRRYAVTAKVGLRALMPTSILNLRERLRAGAPWLDTAAKLSVQPIRSDRSYLLHLLRSGFVGAAEVPERVFAFADATLAWPLFDLRLVQLGLRLPPLLRAPIPGPKPVLARGLLEAYDERLVKAPLGGFVEELIGDSLRRFPTTLGRGSLAANLGLVRREGLEQVGDLRWVWQAADLLGLEIWLRERERHGV